MDYYKKEKVCRTIKDLIANYDFNHQKKFIVKGPKSVAIVKNYTSNRKALLSELKRLKCDGYEYMWSITKDHMQGGKLKKSKKVSKTKKLKKINKKTKK